jgi:saccharopine dehydrogenase-like NADP-dependent oxidoreductase
MAQHKMLIIGAGKIGITVASLLSRTGDYVTYLGDIHEPKSLPLIRNNPIQFIHSDIKKPEEIKNFINTNKIDGVVSCLPYDLTIEVAKIASECGIHYFDPTEDVATTNAVNDLAQKSVGSFAPQCGLAPGFISITANSLMDGFDEIDHVKMRVGALTQNTSNSLHYAFTWSIDGVINEYIHPCLVIENGERKLTPALGGLESIIVDNDHYEAFHTSGGVGSLVESYHGKVKNMDYKTMRYPGHCNKMSFILQDLRLRENPELAKQILSRVIPHAQQDKVVVYVSVQGYRDGRLSETSYTNTLYPLDVDGNHFTAIQMTTAAGICTIIDMVVHEKKLSGLIKQEQITLTEFLANRFGSYYAKELR